MNLYNHLLNKLSFKKMLSLSLFVLVIVATIVFVHNNHFLYGRTIAKVLETELVDKTEVENPLGNKDHLFTQRLK